jgi:hypothetical protein
MMDKDLMRSEAAHYRMLAEQLKESFCDIDDETLNDTLEGVSDFPDIILEIVRSSLDDNALMDALKTRMDEMAARLSRFKERVERKRALACWAMGIGGIPRLEAEDVSVSLRAGLPKLLVADETKIPECYRIPQPAKLDRQSLVAALKRGEAVEGAALASGEPHIAVRTT